MADEKRSGLSLPQVIIGVPIIYFLANLVTAQLAPVDKALSVSSAVHNQALASINYQLTEQNKKLDEITRDFLRKESAQQLFGSLKENLEDTRSRVTALEREMFRRKGKISGLFQIPDSSITSV